MVTRGITHLLTTTFPVVVIQSVFSLLPLGMFLFPFITLNRYQPIDSTLSGQIFLPLHQGLLLLSTTIGFGHDSSNLLNSEKVT